VSLEWPSCLVVGEISIIFDKCVTSFPIRFFSSVPKIL
jgi:hypothetical protein